MATKRKLCEALPEVYSQIDQERTSQLLKPLLYENLGVFSQEEVVWKCSKHKGEPHYWITRVGYRTRDAGEKAHLSCRKCREEVLLQRKQSILTNHGVTNERIVKCRQEFTGSDFDQVPIYGMRKYEWKCQLCKAVWYARMESRLLKNNNCPNQACSCFVDRLSKNERRCQKALEDLNIPFRFNYPIGCVNIRPLTVDFYIEAGVVCPDPIAIEIDGQHHFSDPKVQERDRIKNQYCADKQIHMIRIHYAVNRDYAELLSDFFTTVRGLRAFQALRRLIY